MNMEKERGAGDCIALAELRGVLDALLGPEGCSWDREQTPASLCDYVIEEAHELVEAVRAGRPADVCGEMGDVMFLLLFLARLYADQGEFGLDDALKVSAAKMIRRHPHVFAGTVFADREEQLLAWERIKRAEKAEEGKSAGIFADLPKGLPPSVKAYRIHSKAARAGFTWDEDVDVEQQAEAEWLELLDAAQGGSKEHIEHELGDLLFTLVEYGRRKGIKAGAALEGASLRFLRRFSRMEEMSREQGRDFPDLDMGEKNALWDAAKAEGFGGPNTTKND